jgi:hypothetical protein
MAIRWRKKRRATIQNWLSGWLLSGATLLVGIELAAVVITNFSDHKHQASYVKRDA